MDESNVSLVSCFTLDNLMRAARECARRTRFKAQVQLFMLNLLTECATLQDRVLAGTWEPTKGQTFTKRERGKDREITPRDMRTRVVERCLCDNILEPFIRSEVVDDCSACLKGRGLTYAIDRVRSILEDAPTGAWAWQYDVHGYFPHVNRTDALAMMGRRLPADVVELVSRCIGGPGIGMDLGSHVSQITCTWYLTPVDRKILRLPGLVGHHRHMDDGIGVSVDRDSAFYAMESLIGWLGEMGLETNPRKTHVNRATHPHVYCGKRFTKRADHVKVNVPKSKSRANVRHVRKVVAASDRLGIDTVPVLASSAGYLDSGDARLSTRLLDDLG